MTIIAASRVCLVLKPTQAARCFRTSAAQKGGSLAQKTPIQEFGYKYLQRQEKLGRPLSPHLSIYKPQLTWVMSGANRFVGCLMAGTLLVGGGIFTFVDFGSFVEVVRSLNLPVVVTQSLKFVIAFPIVYHILNSTRYIGFDLAKFIDLPGIYRTGYAVLALSTLLSLLIVLNAKRDPSKTVKKA
ncbi:MEV-1 protein [Aphelenchoides avenae]|nr:MEV-1 protein [Aphelenchus avenae]